MNRLVFLVAGTAAIVASFLAVFFVLPEQPGFAPSTLASIALPALVAGLVMTAYIAFDFRRSRETTHQVSQLSAQLIRKEIEIDRLSTVDELTGLNTRRHLDENLKLEFGRARRHQRPLALMLVELDDLQDLGEHVGKLSKGYMLAELGAILRGSLRANDIGCRYSGECLALLLPETTTPHARAVAEKVRALVAGHEFLGMRQDGNLALTVSQGIAVWPAAGMTTHHDLMRAAEEALGDARASGFNQVAMFTTPHASIDEGAAATADDGAPATAPSEQEQRAS